MCPRTNVFQPKEDNKVDRYAAASTILSTIIKVQGSRVEVLYCYITITEAVAGNTIFESQAPSTVQYKNKKYKRNTSKES